jgi:hypothetical protein
MKRMKGLKHMKGGPGVGGLSPPAAFGRRGQRDARHVTAQRFHRTLFFMSFTAFMCFMS